MKCGLCGTIFPNRYALCPHCKGDVILEETFVPKEDAEADVVEYSPWMVNGEINFDEMSDE